MSKEIFSAAALFVAWSSASIYEVRVTVANVAEVGMGGADLDHYFAAILEGSLEFALDSGKVLLNSATMLPYFDDAGVRSAAEASGGLERLDWAKDCTEIVSSGECISETINVTGLGEFEVLEMRRRWRN